MIWSIVHTPEMQDGTTPIFRFYQEVIGKENIRLAVVDEDDRLDFVSKDDMVLVRTANRRLWKTICSKMVRSTLEDQWAYELAEDKASLSGYLSDRGIRVPRQFGINDIVDGDTYFVKPRFGSDSKGISDLSVCRSKKDVARQIAMISKDFGQDAVIEEFVDGFDCTVSCWQDEGSVQTVAIGIECNGSAGGIQTFDGKLNIEEYCYPINDREVEHIARTVFSLMKIKHCARIDFRGDKSGRYYLIDVNLMPGLGPLAHFPKSLLLARNMSYRDAINAVISSAT